jgi:hypothetical protein
VNDALNILRASPRRRNVNCRLIRRSVVAAGGVYLPCFAFSQDARVVSARPGGGWSRGEGARGAAEGRRGWNGCVVSHDCILGRLARNAQFLSCRDDSDVADPGPPRLAEPLSLRNTRPFDIHGLPRAFGPMRLQPRRATYQSRNTVAPRRATGARLGARIRAGDGMASSPSCLTSIHRPSASRHGILAPTTVSFIRWTHARRAGIIRAVR